MAEIKTWKEIENQFGEDIILGNGSSIAIDKRFSYLSLFDYANSSGKFSPELIEIFREFKTSDFEYVLRSLWGATKVNLALNISEKLTEENYKLLRNALVETVREVHPRHEEVAKHFEKIIEFLKKFKITYSLNYDLIIYWAFMHHMGVKGQPHAFKDCFIREKFQLDWMTYQKPIGSQKKVTLFMYPHGNLVLGRNKNFSERKLSSRNNLLDDLIEKWQTGEYTPLFISEGTSEIKTNSIETSPYLNTILNNILPQPKQNLVIYGWSIGEHDNHLVEKIKESGVKKIAVSVHNHDQDFCDKVERIFKRSDRYDVHFFDAASEGCWIY